jgi:predicted metalloendopeptidase
MLASASAQAANFYKYRDDSGAWVIAHSIPADRAKFGYLVVDGQGRVLDTVERELTAEEYQAKQLQEERLLACNRAVKRVRNLYQDQADIDYAEQKALESIETSIANLRANLTHIRNQKKELEAQAAQMDLAGQTLPPTLLENIGRAQDEEGNLEEAIAIKMEEKQALSREYDADRAVFELPDCSGGLPPSLAAGR